MIYQECPVVCITEIRPHSNADRLEIAVVNGWQVVVSKGLYKQGDLAIYIPIDSVLPKEIEDVLFPEGSKIKLTNSRVRACKIRQEISFGMLIRLPNVEMIEGQDVGKQLGITKWEVDEEDGFTSPTNVRSVVSKRRKTKQIRYIDIVNLRNHNPFTPTDMVSITEKLHGTSVRFGYFPVSTECHGFMHKTRSLLLRFFMWIGIVKPTRWLVGTRNTEVTGSRSVYDIHAKAFQGILKKNEILWGEIVGPKIQKGYHYGLTNGTAFYAYDVTVDGKFLTPKEFSAWCDDRNVPRVPLLFEGIYDFTSVKYLAERVEAFNGQQVREGVVIKSMDGRFVRKYVSDTYLLNKNTNFH